MNHKKEATNGSGAAFIMGLFAGAAVGAGIGLLYAPRKGTELREQLSDAAAGAGEAISNTVDSVKQSGRQLYEQTRDVAARAGRALDSIAPAG